MIVAPDCSDQVVNRSNPICDSPSMSAGNKPIDGGHYIFTEDEKAAFLAVPTAPAEIRSGS
jgi:hypothetical protein